MNLKIYICHYSPLIDRKAYLDVALPTTKLPFEFFNHFNRDNIKQYEQHFSQEQSVLDFKNSHMLYKCNEILKSSSIKATNLEHVRIYRSIVESNYDYHLILEDDAILCNDFNTKLNNTINNLPKDWDVVYVSSGCENRPQIKCQDGTNFVKMEERNSWTANGYLLKKETAQQFLDNIRPMILPIDFELNFLQNYLKSNVYWLEFPIIFEGSNPISGTNYKYHSSQLR
jgi:GR25 family glycosyltransferase involved in LPS biosynthesis